MKEISCNDSAIDMIAQVLEEMKTAAGGDFSPEKINLAELSRRTGITRQRLRTLQKNGFQPIEHGNSGQRLKFTVLDGYTAIIDNLLKLGVTNSTVAIERLRENGFTGSQSTVKRYISDHKDLVPVKRLPVEPQGRRALRYESGPGEAYQMDWGFTKVIDYNGSEYEAACLVLICHHCGMRFVEFFTNAKQENLFIGMIHAFTYMGVPRFILTDNMKSVVIKRDYDGRPIWQKDYETFMRTIGFRTKLCKPRHPYTKGKVERQVRFVKDNFLAGRTFRDLTDLNLEALAWCNAQNSVHRKEINDYPTAFHGVICANVARKLEETPELFSYMCPERRISFDGFINYEGRRFGVPFRYTGQTARVCRKGRTLYIYSSDMKELLVTHDVTWSHHDRYCSDQFLPEQPEEFPTVPVKTEIRMIPEVSDDAFMKFNFGEEDEL